VSVDGLVLGFLVTEFIHRRLVEWSRALGGARISIGTRGSIDVDHGGLRSVHEIEVISPIHSNDQGIIMSQFGSETRAIHFP
jgi:hypothetical protein